MQILQVAPLTFFPKLINATRNAISTARFLLPFPSLLPLSSIVVFTQGKQQNSLECRKHRKFVNNWNFHSSSRKQRTLSVFPPLSIPSLSLYFSTSTPLSRTLSLCLFPSHLAIWARCNQRESSKKSWQQLITRQTQQKSKKPCESGSRKGCQQEGAVKRGIRQGRGDCSRTYFRASRLGWASHSGKMQQHHAQRRLIAAVAGWKGREGTREE